MSRDNRQEGSELFQHRKPDPAVLLWGRELGGRGSFRAEERRTRRWVVEFWGCSRKDEDRGIWKDS